jgi:hypothetical protein
MAARAMSVFFFCATAFFAPESAALARERQPSGLAADLRFHGLSNAGSANAIQIA